MSEETGVSVHVAVAFVVSAGGERADLDEGGHGA
jgi:hypothetical protein